MLLGDQKHSCSSSEPSVSISNGVGFCSPTNQLDFFPPINFFTYVGSILSVICIKKKILGFICKAIGKSGVKWSGVESVDLFDF